MKYFALVMYIKQQRVPTMKDNSGGRGYTVVAPNARTVTGIKLTFEYELGTTKVIP